MGTERSEATAAGTARCAACGHAVHDFARLPAADYAYLLGVYLGDGCLARSPRGVWRLVVALDACYPGIVEQVAAAVTVVRGRRPGLGTPARGERCVVVTSYWKSWPCLFPQHGPGRKHERPIALVEWQRRIVEAAPQPFLRGLIHTDGWRGLNRVTAKGREYAYPRYQFSNRSHDIRRLFTEACDLAEIAWRPWGRWHVSVARREAVARMDAFVGEKA